MKGEIELLLLLLFFFLWTLSLTLEQPFTATDATRVEAAMLVFLCSPFAKIRTLALEILHMVRVIEDAFKDEEDDVPAQRVDDIVNEAGPDVLQRLHADILFHMRNPSGKAVRSRVTHICVSFLRISGHRRDRRCMEL